LARKLKTYQTSLGFFDLAIAAPSMKAAAKAWGTSTQEFKRGFAKHSDDPEIVAATMAKPGVVLKRPVGSYGPFREQAKLPKDLPLEPERPAKHRATATARNKPDEKAAREAALAFERAQKRRESARRKEEAAREKRRKRRERIIAKAERALHEANRCHEIKTKEIERERAVLENRLQAEDSRWETQKEKLESALRRARDI
jgi:colicin import membrane protein